MPYRVVPTSAIREAAHMQYRDFPTHGQVYVCRSVHVSEHAYAQAAPKGHLIILVEHRRPGGGSLTSCRLRTFNPSRRARGVANVADNKQRVPVGFLRAQLA